MFFTYLSKGTVYKSDCLSRILLSLQDIWQILGLGLGLAGQSFGLDLKGEGLGIGLTDQSPFNITDTASLEQS